MSSVFSEPATAHTHTCVCTHMCVCVSVCVKSADRPGHSDSSLTEELSGEQVPRSNKVELWRGDETDREAQKEV